MKLDYNPSKRLFFLRVPRAGNDVQALIREHGLDFSTPASTTNEAVLFTSEPYAAASFGAYATPAAREQLGGILAAIASSWKATSGANFACPSDRELWEFQKADIAYALERKGTIIGDQPGLGKTPVAICFGNEIRAKRVLAIVPASIRIQWVKRIREWTTLPWNAVIHPIMHGRSGVHPDAAWTVVSYDLARVPAIWQALARQHYDLLVLDEAHFLKTIDSRRTRSVFGGGDNPAAEALAHRSERILALTGTPLPNRPREAYTLARALNWDSIDWLSEDGFRDRFNPSMMMERMNPITGKMTRFIDERSGRHGELQNRLRANIMVRHLKREVLPQLKLPVFDIIEMDDTGPVRQALAAEKLLDIDPENIAGADAAVLGHIAAVRKMMGVALAPQIADYIDMIMNGGEEKLVVFAWHIEVMNILEKAWRKHGIVRIDGSTGAVRKQRLVEEFINNPEIGICLGNLLSMGTGTDGLQQVASHAIIAEPDWTPGNNEQAFDRLDRGGQTRQVQGDILVAPGSIAARVLASALRKHQTTHKALDRSVA